MKRSKSVTLALSLSAISVGLTACGDDSHSNDSVSQRGYVTRAECEQKTEDSCDQSGGAGSFYPYYLLMNRSATGGNYYGSGTPSHGSSPGFGVSEPARAVAPSRSTTPASHGTVARGGFGISARGLSAGS